MGQKLKARNNPGLLVESEIIQFHISPISSGKKAAWRTQ